MSDDIPLIFAQQATVPPPVALFLSATHPNQMEQFVLAGWRVMLAQDFTGCEVPPQLIWEAFDPNALVSPPALLSATVNDLPEDWSHRVRILTPDMVKMNAAFSEDADPVVGAASSLTDQGYTLCAAYWRDDNVCGFKLLDRIDLLSVFQPTPWSNLNLLAFRDEAQARDMLRFGRFYAGQEKRIGELQIAKSIRGDYINQLEDALQAHQSDGAATSE